MTPTQCKAARALLGWSQRKLANETCISRNTINFFENETRPVTRSFPVKDSTTLLIRMILEKNGIIFIDDTGVDKK